MSNGNDEALGDAGPAGLPTDEVETVGLSPKAIYASLTATITPIVAGFLLDKVGLAIDVSVVAALVGSVITLVGTFVAAYWARVGAVVRKTDDGRSVRV